MLINTKNLAVYQRFVILALINRLFWTVDLHYYHIPLINAVDVSVDQRPLFERRNTCDLRNAVSQTGTVDQRQQRRDASTILLTRLHFLAVDQWPIIGR